MMLTMNINHNTKFIFKCIKERNNFFVIYYLKHSNSLYIIDENGNNVIINIIKYGTTAMFKYMMTKYRNIDLNIFDDENVHALFYIVQYKEFERGYIQSVFSRCSADINMNNATYGSLLFHTIQQKNIFAIEYILTMNVDINGNCPNEEPIIFHSVINGLLEISNLIIEHRNYDINKPNSAGESILEVAIIKNMPLHSIMILNKIPDVIKYKTTVVKLMGTCIENKNTTLAFKLYQHHCAYVIQSAYNAYRKRRHTSLVEGD